MRIFIAIHYLEIGGVETSLINLLLALDPNRVEVDLLVYDPRGEMMELIPDWVPQIKAPKAYHYIERPLKETLLTAAFKVAWARLKAKWEMRIKFLQSTHRERLLAWVVPEYLRQVFQHLAAAKRTLDTPTIQAFEAYQNYVQQQYSDIIKQYAPHLWQQLKWEQSLLGQFLCRVKNRLFQTSLLKYSFSSQSYTSLIV